MLLSWSLILALACGPKPAAPQPLPEVSEDARALLVPIGRWIQVGGVVGYTYVDPEAGLSMQGYAPLSEAADAGLAMVIVRLQWRSPDMVELSEEERLTRGLPEQPRWLDAYGPQPQPGSLHGLWRLEPGLIGRFHEAYPDDIQVVIYDADEPAPPYEVVWVRVSGCADQICRGSVLNPPSALVSVTEGQEIAFGTQETLEGLLFLKR